MVANIKIVAMVPSKPNRKTSSFKSFEYILDDLIKK